MLLYHSHLIPLRHGLPMDLELVWRLQASALLYPISLPVLGLQVHVCSCLAFYIGPKDLNSCLHAFAVNALTY